MTAPDDATRRQIAAADPARCTWLGANAGSGKTRVLTDRVARLLLAGTPPQNILCLTYTKAAASEMQNRLFRRLGDWAMKPDAELRAALADLGVAGPQDGAALDNARRLFAKAIETPGGLKIQTIHAFCAALLRQFPLEAQVSPNFTELDDRSSTALGDEVIETLSDGPEGWVIDGIARYVSDDGLARLTGAVLKARAAFATPLSLPAACAAHGLPRDFDLATLAGEVLDGGEDDLFTAMLPVLRAKGGNDAKAAEKIAPLIGRLGTMEGLLALESVLLTGKGTAAGSFVAKIDSFPTKPTRAKLGPSIIDPLNDLMQRVEAGRDRRLALASAQRTAALHAFAAAYLPVMEARKAAQGFLDFDDLILKARDLLTRPAAAQWVLYKLDGRIDHILVDEAQDTSPEQWDVIRLLAQELTAGTSARDSVQRTIFVVGDKKQSIYSFQGADPAAFDRLRAHFNGALSAAGTPLQQQQLEHSFRSSAALLEAVDATFATADAATGIGGPPRHLAFKTGLPGRVDLWPWVEPEDAPDEDRKWYEPRDKISPRAPEARLANAIASELRRLIDAGETVPDGDGNRAALHEGHVLILVQRRGTLFRELIRACKANGLAIAGADRLALTRDMAVRDLLALLAFLALPEDDLSLACALRSPLIGWTEDQLYRLAQPRPGYLWQALRTTMAGTPTHAMLADLRDHADFQRPFDLLERVLTRHGGREKLVARLGPDCEEAVDALLGEALNFERSNVPSLTGFLEWMRADSAEVKRQPESAGRQLRVMTVHGSKGLEAPVVILPDCGTRQTPKVPPVLRDAQDIPFWSTNRDDTPEVLADLVAASAEKETQERLRLLYVAMTRAESWLWVCAAGGPDKTGDSWHARVQAGLVQLGAAACGFPPGPGLRWAQGDWTALPERRETATGPATAPLPAWVAQKPPPPPQATPPIAATSLGGDKVIAGDAGRSEEAALRRGRQLHMLLEHLPDYPEASWQVLAFDILGMSEDPADQATAQDVLAEATAVLTAPSLRPYFAPGTLSEVALTCPLDDLPPPHDQLTGVIDRLVINDDHVLAIDYKSNMGVPATPEATPEGLLRQMGAYCAALERIYPDRQVNTALLWTTEARLMHLPRDLVMAALRRAGQP